MSKRAIAIITATLMVCSFTACTAAENGSSSSGGTSVSTSQSVSGESTASSSDDSSFEVSVKEKASVTISPNSKLGVTDIFSSRDLTQTADTSDAQTITAEDGKTVSITEEGVYVITGTASEFTVKVEADDSSKVQLVLDKLNVTNSSFPVIYVVSADKCFVTTAGDSKLSVTGAFNSDGSTNTDAVIFSMDDLVLNGTAALTVSSAQGNGITGKDSLRVTGGTYNITSAKHALEANDCIAISDGTLSIRCNEDGLHCENNDDDSVGWILIAGGVFNIESGSDAIHGTTYVEIDDGQLTLTAGEGIEATYIQINGGTVSITASDDGINAGEKSKSIGTPTAEFTGGNTTIVVGQGDTDAVDSNGDVIVSGGTINITSTVSSFDYDGTATYTGGTIIINGTQVDSIPQPTMMGGGPRR